MKKRQNKIGQVSVFIVIALLIVGSVIIIYAFREKIGSVINNGKSNPVEISEINSAIESCAEQRAIDAIRIVGLQGGYVNLPDKYLETNISNVAYGYYNGKNTLASKETIEKEISYYIRLSMPFCIYDEYNGFNVTKSDAIVSTKIDLNSVSVSTKMPVSAAKGEKAFRIDRDYKINIPIRLGEMIGIANIIINKEVQNPNYIHVSYLAGLNYNVLAMPKDDDNMVYAIVDISNKSGIDGIPYSFLFANKFK